MNINEELQEVYATLPKMKKDRCQEFCLSGKCKNECCTITGASPKERKNINNHIRENGLKLPFIKQRLHSGYVLPFGDPMKPKCEYLGDKGCLIYEVRPAICRLFGAVKQMPCSYQPREARHADYPLEAMVKTGMITPEQYDRGQQNGGMALFERLLDRQKKPSLFQKVIKKFI